MSFEEMEGVESFDDFRIEPLVEMRPVIGDDVLVMDEGRPTVEKNGPVDSCVLRVFKEDVMTKVLDEFVIEVPATEVFEDGGELGGSDELFVGDEADLLEVGADLVEDSNHGIDEGVLGVVGGGVFLLLVIDDLDELVDLVVLLVYFDLLSFELLWSWKV